MPQITEIIADPEQIKKPSREFHECDESSDSVFRKIRGFSLDPLLANCQLLFADCSYGMKPRSSGSAPAIGTSNNGPGPSGSMVKAPLVEKKIAICVCAPTATKPGAPTRFVRKVCGFLGKVGFAANAKSLRKNVARSLRSPERINAVAVGFGTVLSPRANWMITGFDKSPGK